MTMEKFTDMILIFYPLFLSVFNFFYGYKIQKYKKRYKNDENYNYIEIVLNIVTDVLVMIEISTLFLLICIKYS